jgi:glycosyltransferase involved in cell wall biosynthesis
MSDKPIRVLALCDSPTTATGFAMVSRHILQGLKKRGNYEIDVIGINYLGDYYDREKHPYNIFPAMPQGFSDMYGRGRLMNALNGVEESAGLKRPWDIVFTIQDPFIIEGMGISFPFAEQMRITSALWKRQLDPSLWFKWIGYFPVDASIKENWVTRSIALCDYPVAYCDWGKGEMMKFDRYEFETNFTLKQNKEDGGKPARLLTPSLHNRMNVITHGVSTEIFHPLPKEEVAAFRKEYFSDMLKDDTFLIVNVSRNQPRKDLARTIAAFANFKERVPDSFLYLHCKAEDLGGSVHEMCRNFGMVQGKDYSTPKNFSANTGYPIEMVNKIYNAADVCVTTTLGEGWGFITTEAMATKTPIVAPNITSILDIFNSYDYDGTLSALEFADTKLRGIPVKAGSTSSEWICMGLEDNERIRPLTNVDDLVDKMYWVYKNKDSKALKRIVDNAFEWVHTLKWENVCEQWHQLFQKAYTELENDRQVGRSIDTTNRNEPCPCGSGEKFKKCHGSEEKLARYRDWLIK